MVTKAKSLFLTVGTTATLATFYTCPPNCKAVVKFLRVTNSGGSVDILLDVYKLVGTSRFSILADRTFTSKESLAFEDFYLVLEAGDKLEVTPTGTTPSVDIIATVEEQFIANQGL